MASFAAEPQATAGPPNRSSPPDRIPRPTPPAPEQSVPSNRCQALPTINRCQALPGYYRGIPRPSRWRRLPPSRRRRPACQTDHRRPTEPRVQPRQPLSNRCQAIGDQSFWLLSLHVMEAPRLKSLAPPGLNSCACWPKADFNVAWGKAPGGVRNTPRSTVFCPNNSFWLAEGQPQPIVPFQKGHFFCGFCSLRPIPPSGDSQVGFQSTMDRWSVTRPGALPWAKLT
ncbi:MAG: hypothetical protein RLY70_4671 [Planctomycetota bacterium]